MDQIHDTFVSAFQEYQIKKEKVIKETLSPPGKVSLPSMYNYMSTRMRQHITLKSWWHLHRETMYDGTSTCIDIYTAKPNAFTQKLVQMINFYITALNKIKRKDKVNIIIFLTNLRKRFPSSFNDEITEDNVNSGVTFFDKKHDHILIYRREEIFKVLLHELIHLYRLDFHSYDSKYDERVLATRKFCLHQTNIPHNMANPLAMYEGFTDTIACIGNIIAYVLFQNNKTSLSQNALKQKIQELIQKEKRHYMEQASRILAFYRHRECVPENTHIFSYFFIKAYLFDNLQQLDKMMKENKGVALDTVQKQERYLALVSHISHSQRFWNKVNNTFNQDQNTIISSPLRMTNIIWAP